MNILIPKTITAAMFAAGTNIPAVDAAVGEVAWASGATYAVGDRRVDAGYAYECIKAVTGAPANTYAPSAPLAAEYWYKDEEAPTNRMAPFDEYLFTKARRAGSVTYVLKPGFINGVAIHGVEADRLLVSATAGSGGADLMPPVDIDLWQQAYGEWEYLFGDLQRATRYTTQGIAIHPGVELTITALRNTPSQEAAIGYIGVGQWQQLFAPQSVQGAAMYGASAAPRSYSYFKQTESGVYVRKRGRQSIDLNIPCIVAASEGNRVRDLLARVLDVPVAIEASGLHQYAWLSTVGFVTGKIDASDSARTRINFEVKGNV